VYGPPTLKLGKLYRPSARVTVEYTVPVGRCVMVTVAPGIVPLLSVTVPLTLAVVTPCADAFLLAKNVAPINNNKSKYLVIRYFFS